MTQEALKLALEALEHSHANEPIWKTPHREAITAIKEALAQTEQEPFCYHDGRNIVGKEFADHSDVFPLYTHPQAREPLTNEQAYDLFGVHYNMSVIRNVEAAHGIKE